MQIAIHRGGGSKLVSQCEGKQAVGVNVHGMRHLFRWLYVFDLWQSIREIMKTFTNRLDELQVVYVNS